MLEKLIECRKLELVLKIVIWEDQFYLVYQLCYNFRYFCIDVVEVLVCWQYFECGNMMFDQFILFVEEMGFIINFSNWVICKVCIEMYEKLLGFLVLVNILVIEFQVSDFVERIKVIFDEIGFEFIWLEIEVIENVMFFNLEKMLQIMMVLKKMGVCILIDDFGIGYVFLSYLWKFQFDGLKFDKSFIFFLGDLIQNQLVVEKIIDLGKVYFMEVIVEGVEIVE